MRGKSKERHTFMDFRPAKECGALADKRGWAGAYEAQAKKEIWHQRQKSAGIEGRPAGGGLGKG
jgi:hypothetical protein